MPEDSYFLTKTTVDPRSILALGGNPVIAQHDSLREFLVGHAGHEAADILAEPVVSRGSDGEEMTVSWYVARSGEGERLTELAGDERAAAERALRTRLVAVSEQLRNPDFGPLVGAALYVNGLEDIWVVDGRPFLVNWGMLPPDAAADVESREQHFAGTLGRFLPISGAPAISREEWQDRGYTAAGALASGVAMADSGAAEAGQEPGQEPGAGRGGEAQGDAGDGGRHAPGGPPGASAGASGGAGPAVSVVGAADPGPGRRLWVAPAVLLGLLVVLLIWLLWPGTLLYPGGTRGESVIEESAVVEAQREANRALESRIAELRGAIDGAVCTERGQLLLPDGRTLDGRPPLPPDNATREPEDAAPEQRAEETPEQRAAAPTEPVIPPAPQRLAVPDQNGNPASLLELIENASALVLSLGADGSTGHGTGFFVTPEVLVTNHHVIANALTGGRVLVANQRLGHATPAEVFGHLGPLETAGGDYAVLRVPGADMPSFGIWAAEDTLKLRQVIAAGFPGYVLETDADFQQMMQGDLSAIPGVVVTDGIVNAEQDFAATTRVVVHTAQISSGNSGGPLIDACGRVVGVNTFVRNDQSSLNHLNFSLASRDLLGFLEEQGIAVTRVDAPCEPTVDTTPAPSERTAQSPDEPGSE